MSTKKKNKNTGLIDSSLYGKLAGICLVASLVVIVITASFAAYTSLSSAKRVVSTTGAKQLFSSNLLTVFDEEDGPSTRLMTLSSDGDICTFRFNICNYAQGDKTKWSTKDLPYNLSVRLIDDDGNEVKDSTVTSLFSIKKADGTDVKFSEWTDTDETLEYDEGGVTEHTYIVTVPMEYMDIYKIKIVALTDVSGYSTIGRIVAMIDSKSSAHWKGEFIDAIFSKEGHKESELGAINTRIFGQENEYINITWDTKYVEIDPWFLEDLETELADAEKSNYTITEANGKKTLRFEVGGPNQPIQYYIVFFRTASAKATNNSWSDLKQHISFKCEDK